MERFNFNGYKMLVQSSENDLVEYLGRNIKKLYGEENCNITDDYIFAKGKCPIILCAHMDTVFTTTPKTVLFDKEQGLIWSPEGIGGDDRNGIYSILYILSKFKDNLPYVCFTTQEEHGCVGAHKAVKPLKSLVKDVKFAIQIDRKGSHDAVFYRCNNRKFIDYICKFGYKEVSGLSTDICVFCPDWNIAGVNFSCGYINNHTEKEIVSVKNMFKTIDMIIEIIKDVNSVEKFPYYNSDKKVTFSGNNTNKGSEDDDLDTLIYFGGKKPSAPNNDEQILLSLLGIS